MDEWTDGLTDELMDGSMDGWMYTIVGWMDTSDGIVGATALQELYEIDTHIQLCIQLLSSSPPPPLNNS